MLTPTLFRYQGVNGVDRVFDRFFSTMATPSLFEPAADVRESKESYEITLELPGMNVEQVSVTVENGVLTISGEKTVARAEDAQYHVVERQFGKFERHFTLPRSVAAEQVTARFTDGVLVVSLPKAEAAKARRVQING